MIVLEPFGVTVLLTLNDRIEDVVSRTFTATPTLSKIRQLLKSVFFWNACAFYLVDEFCISIGGDSDPFQAISPHKLYQSQI
ncbi:hypothetical protein NBRC116187_35530 [Halopseudomonas sabulinigri]|uniref:Uncharacterized protein n=2 Tax=Halopseudomonas sabulinigri TaxID=472181 RepID=A0ABP9ZUS3_9GAMM